MPDGRTIASGGIDPRTTGTIATRSGIIRTEGIGRNTSDRLIASGNQAAAMPQSEISRIAGLISQNARPEHSQFISPVAGNDPADDNNAPFFRNPFEVLADSLMRSFGGSTYNPPLTQQSYGYGATSGVNWTLLIIIGAIGVGAYFYFNR